MKSQKGRKLFISKKYSYRQLKKIPIIPIFNSFWLTVRRRERNKSKENRELRVQSTLSSLGKVIMHPKCKVGNKDQSHEIVLMPPFEAKGKPRLKSQYKLVFPWKILTKKCFRSKSRKLAARGEIRWLLTSVRWGVLSACVFFAIHGFTLSCKHIATYIFRKKLQWCI